MTAKEAVIYYLDKKQNGELSKSEIRQELAANFDPEEIKVILNSISNKELEAIQNKKSGLVTFLESKLFSYFFILFGIAVIVTSVFLALKERVTPLAKILPWVMIAGALLMIGKHVSRIRNKN